MDRGCSSNIVKFFLEFFIFKFVHETLSDFPLDIINMIITAKKLIKRPMKIIPDLEWPSQTYKPYLWSKGY